MNILISVEDLRAGGAQTFALRFAQYCKEKGNNVFVFHHYEWLLDHSLVKQLAPDTHILTSDILPNSIDRFFFKLENLFQKLRINFHPRKKILSYFLKKQIIKNKIDVVLSHTIKSDYVCAYALRDIPLPFYITMHGDYEEFEHYAETKPHNAIPNFKDFIALTYSRVNYLIYLNDKNLSTLKKYSSKNNKIRTKKIYNGFKGTFKNALSKQEIRSSLGIPNDAIIFAMVARGVEGKGWKELIDTYEKINESNTYLLLIGEGDFLSNLQATTKNSKIIFTGNHPNPIDLLKACDVGVLPSKFKESLPNSIVEYLFTGLPVIASNTGEVSNMLLTNQGAAGILIAHINNNENENYSKFKNELHDALKKMLNANERVKYKENTDLAFQSFDMESCYNSYFEMIKKDSHE